MLQRGGPHDVSCYACCMRETVIFDTEFTAWEGSVSRGWTAPGEFREILQIGAIRLDAHTLTERDCFNVFVRPVFNPVLSDYIVDLTGITPDTIESSGTTLAEAVSRFLDFSGECPMWCYGFDGRIIAKNLSLLGQGELWPALRPGNIAAWFPSVGVDNRNVNSGALARLVGASFDARAHDAVNDCRSIAEAIRVLVRRGAANPFLSDHGAAR